MGIYEFFATNYATATAATSNASDSRITGTGPQDFELSNESIPNGDSTSDSSDSDSARNHNSSHEFRMPFTDSENTNSSSSSESEAQVSLSESEKQSRSDGSNGSSSSGSGNSPQSKLMFDAWQNRGAKSDASSPDRSANGRASSGQASSRSGSSSTESALRGPPTASFDNGENSTAAGEASLQTTDTYGWSVPTDKSAEVLHPTARALTENMQNSKSSSSGSRTPHHENSGRNEASSSEESGNQGSTSRVQQKTGKISSSERSNDEESASSSSSDDSSLPAGPIPLETNFKTGVVTEESFSSVSSSSSDESGWQSESHSSDESRQSKESDSRQGSKAEKESSNPLRSIEEGQQELSPSSHGSGRSKESSDKSGEQSSGSRRQSKEKKKSSTPLKRMEEARQERLSDSEGSTSSPRNKNERADSKARDMGETKRSSNSSHGSSSSESHYEMKSDDDLIRSANAFGAPTKRAHNDSGASKSSGSSSTASSISPLPKPTIEKLKGGSSSASSRSSASSPRTSRGSASSKSQNENSDHGSSGSSPSSGTRSKGSRSASPKTRGKKRGNNDSGSDSKGSLESFGSSSSSTSNSRAMMQSFGFVAPEDQVTSSDNGSSVSAKSAASTPNPKIEKAGDKSSASSKSSGSSSKESPIGPPLPKRRSEMRGSKDSGSDSKSSDSTKPRIEKAGEKLSDSSSKSFGTSSKVSAFGSPSPKSRNEKVKEQSRSKAEEEVNNFALDKKLLLESDSSSSDAAIPASKEKPRPWSDFVPSPSTDPETKHTVDATARSEHDSDEFQWVPPSDTSGWVPKMRSRLGRDTRKMETQPRVPHLQRQPLLSEAKHDVVSEEKYKPDPPFGNEGNKANVLESSEMPLFYANIIATGTHRPNIENTVGNVPPVPPMDMKMRRKEYHGIPPLSEITVDPRYSDDSTLGTEGFHYAPFMMGGPKAFDQEPQYSSLNIRQLNPMPAVRMSEVLRSEGADPPEVKGRDRASSYLQFINTPLPPAPLAKSQEINKEEKPHPSHAINVNFSRRPEEGENSWVPTQLKSAFKSAGPIQLVPPKEDATLEDPKDVLYYQSTKPPSVKSNSAASNWNPTQISQSLRNNAPPNPMQNSQSLGNHAPPNAMAKSTGSFRAERLINSAAIDDDEESEEEISVEDEEESAYDEVTVASGPSEQNSRPASQMSEPESESEESSSGSSYHPTGILDSSSSGSSSELYSARRSRLQAQANQRKPPIVTPYQRNQPSTANDLEDQRQPLNGRQTSKRPVALIRALIALLCLLLIIAAGVVAYFLTREDGPAPVVASVNPPTNSPTTFVPTQSAVPSQTPSLSPTLASQMPSLSPTKAPTPTPTRPSLDPDIIQDAYYTLIVSAYPQGGDAILNRSSPQRSAFEWLRSVSNVQDLPDNRVLQRYALATLFYSTRGWEWSKASRWLSNEHECSWFTTSTALDICNSNRELTTLSLRENNLDGSVPAEIFALLPLIEEVQLHGNDLEGTIPTEIANLSRLALFDLSSNQVFSNIPSQFGGLSNLKRIALANNKIFSTIPTDLGRLSLLETLDLGANQLTGTIPTSMTRMTNLAGLSLYANYISGTVPRNFASLSNLELIYIDGNYLSGSVSNSLCQLQVREFWADCDRVTCSCCTTCCTAQGCGN